MRAILACALVTLGIAACDNSPAAPESGYIKVSVSTSGGDPDVAYEIVSDDIRRQVSSNESTVFDVANGKHSVELTGVADNCLVNGNAARSVDVTINDTTWVIFGVTCAETGVRVAVRMSGSDAPITFPLAISPQLHLAIAPNSTGAVSRLAPGRYEVSISASTPNCLVAGDSVVTAEVVNRQMTDIFFSIECRFIPRTGVIAFVENATLMVMNADGTGLGELNRGWHPSWSRDGTRLVYSTTDCDEHSCTGSLEMVDPLTRQIIALPNAGFGWMPAWSPVDDVIAFFEPESVAVFLYDVAKATRSKIVVESPVRILHASWSPDGSRLAGACNESGNSPHICVFNRDGTDFRFLTSDPSIADQQPSWSPDGDHIVFTRYSAGIGRIAVMNADGTGLRAVTDGTWPSWSPDGRRIIFSGVHGLHTINMDGTGLQQITDGFHYSAVWRR